MVTDDNGDIEAYRSIAAACRSMEAIDVPDDSFDSTGRCLQISAEGDSVLISLKNDAAAESPNCGGRVTVGLRRAVSHGGQEGQGGRAGFLQYDQSLQVLCPVRSRRVRSPKDAHRTNSQVLADLKGSQVEPPHREKVWCT